MKAQSLICLCLIPVLTGCAALGGLRIPPAQSEPIPEQTLQIPARYLVERPLELDPPIARGDPVDQLEEVGIWGAEQYRPLARDYNALVCLIRDYLDGPKTVAECVPEEAD